MKMSTPAGGGDGLDKMDKSIVFNASKNEKYKVNDNYRIFQRKTKAAYSNVMVNKDMITPELLRAASLFICTGPREQFTITELNSLKTYLDEGGSLLIALGEEGERGSSTNINFLLEQYGVSVNSDCVVRCHFYKYFHPKECFIGNGVLNRGIAEALHRDVTEDSLASSLHFVYPYGASLNVIKPSVPVFSTGSASCPLNRPVVSFYRDKTRGGKLVVLGSAALFSDQYLEREENDKMRQIILSFLLTDDINLNQIDADDADVTDYTLVPEIRYTAAQLKSTLMEFQEVLDDYTRFFSLDLSKVDMSTVPLVLDAYSALSVKHDPLSLIPPQFESPLPPLRPALFPPSFRDLPVPHLELFDLEEEFSSPRLRLGHLASKYTGGRGFNRVGGEEGVADLEYYIQEAGRVVNVKPGGPRAVLGAVVAAIVEFKNNR
ncbi:hypothetical protein M8J77_016152 [Diaphorina citri]|nr:hypothetical protein M8J77_016152 [Diaphorina citri]